MMEGFELLFEPDSTTIRLIGRNRIEFDAHGMTVVARIDGKEIRRGETVNFCELEEIRMSTWHYQLLTDELRESLGHLITIEEIS